MVTAVMLIYPSYHLENVNGRRFIFLRKNGVVDATRMLTFNESSAWLWEQLKGKDFTFDEAFAFLSSHFAGDPVTMKEDLSVWINQLLAEDVILP